jgi:hypothetical protein
MHTCVFSNGRRPAPVKVKRVYDSTRTILSDDGFRRVNCVEQFYFSTPVEVCYDCAADSRNYAGGTRCWDCVQSGAVRTLKWMQDKYPAFARQRSCLRCRRDYMDFSVDGVDCGCPYTDCLYKAKTTALAMMCDWEVMYVYLPDFMVAVC